MASNGTEPSSAASTASYRYLAENKLCGFGVGDQSIGIKPAWRAELDQTPYTRYYLALRF